MQFSDGCLMATWSVPRHALVEFLPIGLRLMELMNCPILEVEVVADPSPPWNEASQPKTEVPRLSPRKRLWMGPVVKSLSRLRATFRSLDIPRSEAGSLT